jgi:hypothetical protein
VLAVQPDQQSERLFYCPLVGRLSRSIPRFGHQGKSMSILMHIWWSFVLGALLMR